MFTFHTHSIYVQKPYYVHSILFYYSLFFLLLFGCFVSLNYFIFYWSDKYLCSCSHFISTDTLLRTLGCCRKHESRKVRCWTRKDSPSSCTWVWQDQSWDLPCWKRRQTVNVSVHTSGENYGRYLITLFVFSLYYYHPSSPSHLYLHPHSPSITHIKVNVCWSIVTSMVSTGWTVPKLHLTTGWYTTTPFIYVVSSHNLGNVVLNKLRKNRREGKLHEEVWTLVPLVPHNHHYRRVPSRRSRTSTDLERWPCEKSVSIKSQRTCWSGNCRSNVFWEKLYKRCRNETFTVDNVVLTRRYSQVLSHLSPVYLKTLNCCLYTESVWLFSPRICVWRWDWTDFNVEPKPCHYRGYFVVLFFRFSGLLQSSLFREIFLFLFFIFLWLLQSQSSNNMIWIRLWIYERKIHNMEIFVN